ncbi:MAG: response regulator transcription factor [Pyrinomonadaceae bacterium]|nr:response regulator transcription factor [Pyrinomonadaceae bacterium]
MKRARILLADSHRLLMEAITKLLEPEFEVVGMVVDGRELLRSALDLKPDVVVLDSSMSVLSGLEVGRQLKANRPGIKLIYLTMDQDGDIVAKAFRLGASAYLLKSCTASDLLDAIRGAWLRPSYLSPFLTRSKKIVGSFMRGQARQKKPLRLTLRQREVLQLLAEGRSMKEVAFALQIKPRTVAYHKYRMMDDFNLGSNAALVRFALRERVA